jgi:hypothetical protein
MNARKLVVFSSRRGDLVAALAVLQQGIASVEHAEFVAALQSRRRPASET